MEYYLGIDIGTSGTKVLLLAESGEITDVRVNDYEIESPRPQWAEQDPGIWWEALQLGIQQLKSSHPEKIEQVVALGLSGQMHGPVFVDAAGQPLHNCLLWADNRAAEECQEITARAASITELTGNPVIPTYTAPKIIWIKKHKPEVYDKTHKILLAKDYIGYKLTGKFFTDYSDASGTLLFNIEERSWSEEILADLELEINKLPEIFSSATVTGFLRKSPAAELGLPEGLPVVAGGGDLACGAVGSNNISEGTAAVTIGTAGQVVVSLDEINREAFGNYFNFCHALQDRYFVLASILSAGLSLKWFKNKIALLENLAARNSELDSYDILVSGIDKVPPGSNGLFFLPYLNGASTPHLDDKARGALLGLTPKHGKKQVVKAIMEGVTFGLYECLETLIKYEVNIEEIIISAGGAKSEIWRQLQADIYNRRLSTLTVKDTSPLGAAVLAAVGAGKFDDIPEACDFFINKDREITPDPAKAEVYQRLYSHYQKIYPALQSFFHSTSDYKGETDND